MPVTDSESESCVKEVFLWAPVWFCKPQLLRALKLEKEGRFQLLSAIGHLLFLN